jgi:hypothetical protein
VSGFCGRVYFAGGFHKFLCNIDIFQQIIDKNVYYQKNDMSTDNREKGRGNKRARVT